MNTFDELPADDPSRRLTSLRVEESCLDLPLTREILARAGDLPLTVIPDGAEPAPDLTPYPQSLTHGKRILHLGRNRGRFLKPCPATRNYRCCDYQVLNIGAGCPMDCAYCILQAYLNNPWLSFYVNIDDLFRELDETLDQATARQAGAEPERSFYRIGTGEFTDSMALDRLTGLSARLIRYMATKSNAVLELKSKAVVLDHLPASGHNGRTVMAWSLNSAEVMHRLELHTADLDTRLTAAAHCADLGYPLAFHFDPIIDHPGWEEGYRETIRRLYQAVPATSIAWISLGAFRFLPALKGVIGSRFPGATFIHEEFVPGLDGKFRYFRPRRTRMYQLLIDELNRRAAPHTCIYFCMENDQIWRQVFGHTPEEKGGLPAMLDTAARAAVEIAAST
ncbi:SPL family radical SAM protein [Desulfurivibrio alkaliphilus]|uniref:DNA repair photolyase-like protein n=1 Tax=Desulfurivibrio alkaliphilus (strain DSM 19089 / UNIQEM U267 / AHT2) TaxID=589865 RepID=D6Z5D0_DESAT|nr:DNA repair photolyase [Desulfurivibrio alkaliphilus]ADH84787.1 DNA repair photolyase-like protein [Desulfurivibrio alkaliphilus AHT 2]